MLLALCLSLVASLQAPQDAAWTWERLALDEERGLDYALQLPEGHRAETPAPLLLVLPPGDQSRAMVERAFELYWSAGAREHGWILASPATPGPGALHEGHLDAVRQLIDALGTRFAVEGERPHLAGVSNGGRSAFDLALADPGRFASLTGAPGMPAPGADARPLAALPVSLFVGGADEAWRAPMSELRELLVAQHAPSSALTVFPDEGHMPESLDGAQLFAQLEQHRQRALAAAAGRAAVAELLEDFHAAASEADEERYFGHFAPEGVFVGTDATERWSVSAFRAYAHPFFSAGQGWTYRAEARHVQLSPDGALAWFDERLRNEKYGAMRGSGVARRVGEAWRLSQYVLSFAVPNEVAPQVVEVIAEHAGS